MKRDFSIAGVPAYHSYPDDGNKHPGLVLIEEIWGLNDHIKNVCDRFATAGFNVLSVELLPQGTLEKLTPQMQNDLFDPAKRDEVQPKVREAMQPMSQPEYAKQAIETLTACVDYLLEDEHTNGHIGVTGFCFGGTYSFHLAAHDARIGAAAPFYGHPPREEEIVKIAGPILAFYGDQDANLMQTLPELNARMADHHKRFESVVYEGAGHAFFNDTNARMYRPDAAKDAWEKVLAFFATNLRP